MTTDLVRIPTDIERKAMVTELVQRCEQLSIITVEDLHAADGIRGAISDVLLLVSKRHKPVISELNKAHKDAVAEMSKEELPLLQARGAIDKKIRDWTTEQERLQRIAEAQVAERMRKLEEERKLAEAQVLQDAGRMDLADQVISEPVLPPPVILPRAVPVLANTTERDNWKANVTDKRALIKAVADGAVPHIALEVNMTYLNQQARSLKDLLRIPGVEAWNDRTTVGKGGRNK